MTLGAKEVDDLEVAVAHLRKAFPNSTIGLWGRSMGAVTALLYSARDPSIAGVVSSSLRLPYCQDILNRNSVIRLPGSH